jgi:hypothetical protein
VIGHCGINCDECPSYKGTLTGDETLLTKVNEEYGNETMDAIDFVCLGCRYPDVKLIATDCARCAIRSCAQARGKDFCATCDEYETCVKVEPYRGDGTSTRDKMNAFLRAKNARANGYPVVRRQEP